MAEPKWTPGPWQVCNTYHAVHGERVRNIALCDNAHIPQGNGRILVSDDEATANAYLIAAAPDLYRELENLVELAEAAMRAANRDGGEYDIEAELAGARAALRKARGESS